MIYETQIQLDEAVVEWQKILRLQDWEVRASVVRAQHLNVEDSDACITYNFNSKRATLQLRDPIDYVSSDCGGYNQDHEVNLVHELLHLHYAGFDTTERGSTEEKLMEQSIEAISRSLVELKREATLVYYAKPIPSTDVGLTSGDLQKPRVLVGDVYYGDGKEVAVVAVALDLEANVEVVHYERHGEVNVTPVGKFLKQFRKVAQL